MKLKCSALSLLFFVCFYLFATVSSAQVDIPTESVNREIKEIAKFLGKQKPLATQIQAGQEVKIKVSKLNVREGPGQNYSTISLVRMDDQFNVLDKKNGWIKIPIGSNKHGWIHEKFVQVIEKDPKLERPPKKEETLINKSSFQEKIILGLIAFFLSALFIFLLGKLISSKENTKDQSSRLMVINRISFLVIGLLYILVATFKIAVNYGVQNGEIIQFLPEILWILIGLCMIFRMSIAVFFALTSFPLIFTLQRFFPDIANEINEIIPYFYTPFHNISLIILQKYALLSTVKPYWSFYIWGVYAIHSACLLPYLFKKGKKARRIRKTKEAHTKFKFPEIVDFYINNSFQILGLIPHKVNARSIHKRKNELVALIKADLPPREHLKDYYSISWPDIGQTTESGLTNAYVRLQDTLKRVEEELFWFHLEEDKMEPFECLLKGDLKKGQELWETEIKDNPKNYAGGNAKHNLAVLMHACVLNQEKNISSNPGMGSSQMDSWKKVFTLWGEVYRNDKCWQYFMQRIVYLKENDSRINEGYIRNNLRKKLPTLVLKPNLEIACSAVTQDMLEYAKQHLDLIKNSGFGPENINTILENFFSNHKKELKNIRKSLDDFPDEEHKGVVEKTDKIKNFVEQMGGEKSIEEEISWLKPLLASKTCYFCGIRTRNPKHTLEVMMHNITERIPMGSYINIKYQTITISIPRCNNHSHNSSYDNHPTVKQYRNEGWSFGEKPPDVY